MKQETNNEMDLLLRRLGRQDDAAAPEDHLDADALNAYAENVLPAAARARYTVHLAECSRCRSLVAQLSSAAGVVAATDSATVSEPSWYRKFLAGLFTPMVLRYAAPALGLIVVAAIGFVVLRRNQSDSFVAKNAAPEQQVQVGVPAAEPTKLFGDTAGTNTPMEEGRVQKQASKEQPQAPGPSTAPPVTSGQTDLSKDKAAPKAEEQTAVASEPPPPKPEPSATPVEAARNEVKVQPAARPDTEDKHAFAREDDRDNVARARKQAGSVSAPASGVGSVRGAQSGGAGDFSSATRTVAGRRFRKQGGVWIDTAHESSQTPVTVKRGSEQYRALIADEPEIKTIADQLEGDIIVVWKGHTYRIN